MSSEKRQQKIQEKYKLRMMEYKEQNQKTICIVNVLSTLSTVALAIGTLVVLSRETTSCQDSHLRFTMWLMIGMHATNILESACQLTGLEKIFCGCLCVIAFFIYEVAVLVYMQSIFYTSSQCRQETPQQYWWLLTNILVYFAFFFATCFFHLKSFCVAPSQKEIEEEVEKEEKGDNKQGNTMH